jgi:hypothetical protein
VKNLPELLRADSEPKKQLPLYLDYKLGEELNEGQIEHFP